MEKKELKAELKTARRDEAYHRKQMEYFQEVIYQLDIEIATLKPRKVTRRKALQK